MHAIGLRLGTRRARVSSGASNTCTLTAPAAMIPVLTATTLSGTVSAGCTGVTVHSDQGELGAGVVGGETWSYSWTPGAPAEGDRTLHAVAAFSAGDPATSDSRSTTVSVVLDFASVGVWSSIWLPDRGITLGGTLLASGTAPPAVSLVSAPSTLSGLWLDIPTGGGLGAGKVRYSLDDGATYSAPETLAASMTLGGFGITFAAGTYNTNNTYKATVAAWTSLEGYVASQATPGKQPVYSSVAWDGHPSLTFDGVDDILVCTHTDWNTLYGGDDANTVLVCALDSAASTSFRYCVGLYGTTAVDVAAMLVDVDSVLRYNRGGTAHGSDSAATGRRHDLVCNVGTNVAAYVNGVAAGAPGTLNRGASTLASVAIGGYYLNGTPGYYTVGNIAAVLLGSTVSDPAGLTARLNAIGIAHA